MSRNLHMPIALIETALQARASDLHLPPGEIPWCRIDGEMRAIDGQSRLSSEDIENAIFSLLTDEQRQRFEAKKSLDIALEFPSLGRFRVNMFRQHRGTAAAFRPISANVRTLEALKAPAKLAEIAGTQRGLVLVTGVTGTGKSTTLAAMIDHLNTNFRRHIITLEDPIETLHTSNRSLIQQREIGKDAFSFSHGLRDAMREDPDVILVGELRDLETMKLACTAAETGHLVLATLHTMSAAKTIDRFIDVFPEAEKSIVRTMLSESLHAVVAQTLLKKAEGSGRIAAHEIMIGTSAIRNLIREGKTSQIHNTIMTGSSHGMITMDQSLKKLVRSGLVDPALARSVAYDPEQLN